MLYVFFSYFRSVAATGNSNKKVKISATDKNPVMLLNELRPGLKYEEEECGEFIVIFWESRDEMYSQVVFKTLLHANMKMDSA